MSITAQRAEVGPMVTGGDVEAAVMVTLRDWLPAYLAEAERQHGLPAGDTPPPRGWAITGRDLQKLNTDQLPCIVVMAGGIVQPPVKEGPPGAYTAIWGVDIGTVFSAAWGRASRRSCQLYARAVHLCLEQRSLALPGCAVDWRGEVYDELDFESSRSYSASVVSFNVEVREVAWAAGGPPPDAPAPGDPTVPFDPWVTVADTDVTVENTPADQPLPE
jgi:hypothetical protein